MTRRVLVAGVGNIFFGDDGFGVEVVRRIRQAGALPAAVDVRDIGIRGIHLVYELMDGCELLLVVDVAARGLVPGTVSVVEPDDAGSAHDGVHGVGGGARADLLDPHGLAPDRMLAAVAGLGAAAGRTLLVVCEPENVEPGIGLSDPVRDAVPAAVRTVTALIAEHLAEHLAEHPAEHPAEHAAKRLAEPSADRLAERPAKHLAERPAEHPDPQFAASGSDPGTNPLSSLRTEPTHA
jgi:hydrogenase maturation protease